jgi:hypothetical protein
MVCPRATLKPFALTWNAGDDVILQSCQGVPIPYCGRFAGGALVPGVAAIDTLPLVWQMVLVPPSWQV